MIAYNKLRGLAILAAVLILLPVSGADARTRKGDKLLKLAQAAEARRRKPRARPSACPGIVMIFADCHGQE